MSPANQAKHESLLRRAEKCYEQARLARKYAAYADSAQAREWDEKQARAYDQSAFDLEAEAARLMESDP
jgi:hypothetical protein